MTPSGWRALVVPMMLVCFAVGAQSASAFDLVDPTHILANPDATVSATADPTRSSNETDNSLYGDAKGADSEFHQDGRDSGGGSSPSQPNPPSLIPHPEDWCRWWSFKTAAQDLQQDPTLDVYQELEGNLYGCLSAYYPTDPNVSWVSEYLALQNMASLLIAIHQATNMTAAYTKLANGVTLPAQTWVVWFQDSAAVLV
jgi:hypothetical protein